MKIVLALFLVAFSLFGANVKMPDSSFKAGGGVTDIVYKDSKLYIATDVGLVDIFDVKSKEIIQKIKAPKIKDFMGEYVDAKIYSVDVFEEKILLLSQGSKGYSELYLYENKKLTKIISTSDELSIAKAKFINECSVLLGLLGNDIISYNIKTKEINWKKQASQSKFSDFVLNESKTEVVIADESGTLHLFEVKNGKLIKTLSGQNLDNVFAVDYKNKTIATAGQDRRAVIYDLRLDSAYYKMSGFLIYGVGLSPSAKLAAFASDEKNNVSVFKTDSKSIIAVFGGNKMTVSKILFISENEFFVASDDRVVNFYKIK